MTDDLIRRCKKNDEKAFEELVFMYKDKIYQTAFAMMGNEHDAADAVQEVFIKIYKSIGGFMGKSKLDTWIYRITTNVCIDELRRRNRYVQFSLNGENDDGMMLQIPDTSPIPEEIALNSEMKKELFRLVSELPAPFRVIITLKDIQELSYNEISEILNCPLGTVKSRIARARQALVREIQKNIELFGKKSV